MFAALAVLAFVADPADPADWQQQESRYLKNVRQVTSDYVRAGEGYFSPDGTKIIFQAEEKGTGNPFYQIFVQDRPGRPRQPRRRQDDLRLFSP
jgi:TolB protein